MSKHWNLEVINRNGLVCKLVFIGYLSFCASVPIAVTNGFDYKILFVIQILICGIFLHHWIHLTKFNSFFSGSVSQVYREIDKIQFGKTKFLDIGFKTNQRFSSGLFANERASKILSDRYDITLVIISFLGEVLVYVSAQDQIPITRGLLSILTREFTWARYLLAVLGGYIFLWGFTLFLFGLVSKVNYMKGLK